MEDGSALIDALELEGEIAREKIESCRKTMIGARALTMLGGAVSLVGFLGAFRFPPESVVAGVGCVIAGVVVYGTHFSTRQEAEARLAAIEAERRELIDGLDLRRVTLH